MSLLRKGITVFNRKPIEWTGVLQRMIREIVEAVQVELSEAELDAILSLPYRIVDLVQSGIVEAVELKAGQEGCAIAFPSEPDAPDDVDLSMLALCDLRAMKLVAEVVVNDMPLARSLGAGALEQMSSNALTVSLRSSGRSSGAGSRPRPGRDQRRK
ncbi:MAG: hypothetical protein FJ291_00080 [Planctomycetes bacterium]|nr:hypothetical protein [Planctomycetota bacterium]